MSLNMEPLTMIVGSSPNLVDKFQLAEKPGRFTCLPDKVIHHIFSFLEMKDICRIGTLSRRFQKLYMSSPYLCFSLEEHGLWRKVLPKRKSCYMTCRKLRRFIDRYLGQRDGIEIQCFSLHWSCLNTKNFKEGSILDAWIHHAMQCNIKEIDLNLYWPKIKDHEPNQIFVLPRPIYSCQSLRVLKLKLPRHSPLWLPSMPLDSLEVLSLHKLAFADEFYLGEWISTFCPLLKKLNLYGLSGMKTLSISSSSLDDIKIIGDDTDCDLSSVCISAEKLTVFCLHLCCDGNKVKSVMIDAPNLQVLKWKGSVSDQCNLGDLRCLQKAKLKLPFLHVDSSISGLLELFNSISKVGALRLKIDTIEFLFIKEHLPIRFPHLHHLDIMFPESKDVQVPAVLSFLNGLLNLKTLSIIDDYRGKNKRQTKDKTLLHSRGKRFHREYGRTQNLLSVQLREVEVDLYLSYKPQMRLVKHLLMHAKGLEKMTLTCFEEYYHQITEKISSFKVADSSVSVSVSCEE